MGLADHITILFITFEGKFHNDFVNMHFPLNSFFVLILNIIHFDYNFSFPHTPPRFSLRREDYFFHSLIFQLHVVPCVRLRSHELSSVHFAVTLAVVLV